MTKDNAKRTPTPWKKLKDNTAKYKAYLAVETGIDYQGTEYTIIARFSKEEDAEFTKKAVNMHEELIEALKLLLDGVENGEMYSIEDGMAKAKEALSKSNEG